MIWCIMLLLLFISRCAYLILRPAVDRFNILCPNVQNLSTTQGLYCLFTMTVYTLYV